MNQGILACLRKEEETRQITQRGADPRLSRGPTARFTGRIELNGQVHYYDSRTHTVERRKGSAAVRGAFGVRAKRAGWVVQVVEGANGLGGCYARTDAIVLRPKTAEELACDAEQREARKARIMAKKELPWAVRVLCHWSGYNRKAVARCLLYSDAATSTAVHIREKLFPGFRYEPDTFVIRAGNGAYLIGDKGIAGEMDAAGCGYKWQGGPVWTQCSRSQGQQFGRAKAEATLAALTPFAWTRPATEHTVAKAIEFTDFEIIPAHDLSPYGPRTRNLLTRLGVPVEDHDRVLRLCGFDL